jgi:hypothetical protein
MSKQTTSPFDLMSTDPTATGIRKLDHTAQLIGVSRTRANGIISTVNKNPDLHDLAKKVMSDGSPTDLISLIHSTVSDDTIKEDQEVLTGASDEELARLLESRRSERSKMKTKGNGGYTVPVLSAYIAAMYAEILVRNVWDKPYVQNSVEFDSTDQNEITKKIKSLQSKKCRLAKTAPFIPADQVELEITVAEISRLSSLRPAGSVNTKTVIKSEDAENIRLVLAALNVEDLPADQQAAFKALMAKAI